LTWSPCSPRPALCYRPLLALLPYLAVKQVTLLGPRTPHQPEKLKKLSKNDCLFTPSISGVNEKYRFVSIAFSIDCTSCTGTCHRFGAVAERGAAKNADFPS
jgi:hypothetical protein